MNFWNFLKYAASPVFPLSENATHGQGVHSPSPPLPLALDEESTKPETERCKDISGRVDPGNV